AEDGIRDWSVTGVQTCALPIFRDQTESGAERGALEVGVHTEAALAGDRVREVDLPVVLQPLALVVGQDRVDDLPGLLRAQDGVRSEERRVGKEGRSRACAEDLK